MFSVSGLNGYGSPRTVTVEALSQLGTQNEDPSVTVQTDKNRSISVQTDPIPSLGPMPKFIIDGTPVTPSGVTILTRMRINNQTQAQATNGYESDQSSIANVSIAPPGAEEPPRKRRRVGSYVPPRTNDSSSSSSSSRSNMEITQQKLNAKALQVLIPEGTPVRYIKKPNSKYRTSGFITPAGDVQIQKVCKESCGPNQVVHVSELRPLPQKGIVLLRDLTTENGKYHGLVQVQSIEKSLLKGHWFGFGQTPLHEVSIKGRGLLDFIPMKAKTLEEAEDTLEGVKSSVVPWTPYVGAEDLYGTFYELSEE